MSLEDDIGLLRAIPFFDGFSAEQLRLLAFSAESRSLSEHTQLYDIGHMLHSGYIITSGLLIGTRLDGKKEVVREIHRGEMLADRAMIVEARAQESVRVIEAATAMQIRRPVFHRFLGEYPEAAQMVRERLAKSLYMASIDYRRTAERLKAFDAG
ncbi:MAG: Crp/Fnr family transcriptional regulator [Alphaproteobacteria bacterium]